MPNLLAVAAVATVAWQAVTTPADPQTGPVPEIQRHPDHTVEIVCHRGVNKHAPENTFAAAALCVAWGIEYVEVDVRTSADGVLYVLHDAVLDRTTDGEGRISETRAAELDLLDAGAWFGPVYAGQRIPRLSRLLEWARGRVRVYLDVKEADIGEVLGAVREAGMEDEVFFWFGDDEHARTLRSLAPGIALKINADSEEGLATAKRDFDAQIIECGPGSLTPEFVARAHELGLRVMLYTRDNDPAVFRRGLEVGIDMVNLDHPDTFIEAERQFLESRRSAAD
ncbi:MAG: glycerophosphodiester phosphodiesterase family protein [Phycisphaerales bacterium JB041]